MNNLLINIFLYDLWFLRYRECPYSVTFPYKYCVPQSYYFTT